MNNNDFSSGEYLLTSSIEDELKKKWNILQKCVVCQTHQKRFYCKYCIVDGDFLSSKYIASNQNYGERFIEKRLRKEDSLRVLIKLQASIEEIRSNFNQSQDLKDNISTVECRISTLRTLLEQKLQQTYLDKKKLEAMMTNRAIYRKRCEQYAAKIIKINSSIRKYGEYIKKRQEQVETCSENIVALKRSRVADIFSYIFPINTRASAIVTSSQSEDVTTSEIADALQMEYIEGEWRYSCESTAEENVGSCSSERKCDEEYSVIIPDITLPVDGNYSAYHHDNISSDEPVSNRPISVGNNMKYKLEAGLVYTTQLVNVLAYFLDVNLPKQLCYSIFSQSSLDHKSFNKAVKKLHRNVVYLCISQGMVSANLRSKYLLQNLAQLQDTPQLARCLHYELDDNLLQSIEDSYDIIGTDGYPEANSSDEDQELSDWESVANLPYQELPLPRLPPTSITSRLMSHYPSAGGFFNTLGLSYFTSPTHPTSPRFPSGSGGSGSGSGGGSVSGSSERRG